MTQQTKTSQLDVRNKEELHAQIDETKSAIAGELRELGEKLSPEHLKEGMRDMLHEAKSEAKEALHEAKNAVVGSLRTAKDHAFESVSETIGEVSERARRAGTVTADFVSANAIPLSLIGLGAGWLMLTMRRQRMMREDRGYYLERGYARDGEFDDYGARGYRDYESASFGGEQRGRIGREYDHLKGEARDIVERGKQGVEHLAEQTREGAARVRGRVSESLSHMSERAGELSHEARDRMQHYGHEARVRVERYGHNTVEFAQENPLAISALAVAAGVGFGLMLPASRVENRLFGTAKDRVMDGARELVADARETAQHAAQVARETAGEVKQSLTTGVSH